MGFPRRKSEKQNNLVLEPWDWTVHVLERFSGAMAMKWPDRIAQAFRPGYVRCGIRPERPTETRVFQRKCIVYRSRATPRYVNRFGRPCRAHPRDTFARPEGLGYSVKPFHGFKIVAGPNLSSEERLLFAICISHKPGVTLFRICEYCEKCRLRSWPGTQVFAHITAIT
jgi:hypothetical protein